MERQYILFSTGLALVAFLLLFGISLIALLLLALWRIPYGYPILAGLALAGAIVPLRIDRRLMRRAKQAKGRIARSG
jgi:hypothetical protein